MVCIDSLLILQVSVESIAPLCSCKTLMLSLVFDSFESNPGNRSKQGLMVTLVNHIDPALLFQCPREHGLFKGILCLCFSSPFFSALSGLWAEPLHLLRCSADSSHLMYDSSSYKHSSSRKTTIQIPPRLQNIWQWHLLEPGGTKKHRTVLRITFSSLPGTCHWPQTAEPAWDSDHGAARHDHTAGYRQNGPRVMLEELTAHSKDLLGGYGGSEELRDHTCNQETADNHLSYNGGSVRMFIKR
jgi:hypothetical protein